MNLTEFNQSDRCEHFFCPERSVSPILYILLYACSAAVVLLTVCGNLLIIISVFYFKQLQTPTNMLVLSLAVSDFLVGALVMPLMLIWTIESCWIFGKVLCISFFVVSGFFMTISIYNVTLIAVDRYLALSHPFLYLNTISRRTTCIVVYCNWCVLGLYVTAFYYFTGTFSSFVMCPGECFYLLNEVWSEVDLVFSFIFPLSIIGMLYIRVFGIAKKHATAIRELNNHTWPKIHMKSERKAAKVLGILVSVFLVCLLPYFIYSLIGTVIEIQAETLFKVLAVVHINSCINPYIYALFYPWFRKCIKLVITLKIFQTDSKFINILS
ncbi:trace amine-associated receptor 13c-like [Clarias gariepinus]|uniref:trace amine-associated receptor 13c-like n=1 Tax=Clarias gariepinus TaxID=13013 RepID=UPI00234C62B7|nr:trace amine-associated receptor 13c-like [Clarias gariepinus]